MDKRGGLFYIIDAFIAAAIITLTIFTVLSQNQVWVDDSLQRSLEEYVTFMSRPSSDSGRSSFDDIALLASLGKLDEAKTLISSVSIYALDSQFGLNIVLLDNGTRTPIYSRGDSLHADNFLTTQVLVSAFSPRNYSTFTSGVNVAGLQSGQDYCNAWINDSRCVYVLTICDGVQSPSIDLCHSTDSLCSDMLAFPVCAFFSEEIFVEPQVIEVSMWVE